MKIENTPPFAQNRSDACIQLLNKPQPELEIEIWEPPFERWMKLADDLLRERPNAQPSHN